MAVRILHVATRHRVGGAERNLLHTISRQLTRGFEVHVAVGTESLEIDFPRGTEVHPLPTLVREVSPAADWQAKRAVQKLIRAGGFDVVHTHQSKAGAVGRMAARGLGTTVVHTVHMASFGPAYGSVQSAIFLNFERRLAQYTDKLVFVGADLRRRYVAARVAPRERSIIIRSPIANLRALIGLRRGRHDHRRSARTAMGIPTERHVVLMVGALDRRKRHALSITALAPLLREGSTEVLIAGQGAQRGPLETLCRDLGVADSVKFLGFVRDVTPLFAAANVFVHVSTLEGVPQAVVQAVAAGVPTVATEVDGVREVAAPPHVTILQPNGQGLLNAVRDALAAGDFPAARPELVEGWLPRSVDARLREFNDWIEGRVNGGRRNSAPRTPASRSRPSGKELAIT
jgi:glycosyltransferase involved in cell wall biosynthesis